MMIEDDDGFLFAFGFFSGGDFSDFLGRSARIEPRLCIQMRLDERKKMDKVSSKKGEIEGDSCKNTEIGSKTHARIYAYAAVSS